MEHPAEPMISREQAIECLRVLGVEMPVPADAADPDPAPRPVALGFLLFMVESAAARDIDRLDHEALRSGYQAGARSVAVPRLDPDADPGNAASFVWTRLIEERVRRTALDLADTAVPPEDGVWSAGPAVSDLLDAALALLGPLNPPDPDAVEEADMVHAVRDSLRTARAHLRSADTHVEDGRRAVRDMGYNP